MVSVLPLSSGMRKMMLPVVAMTMAMTHAAPLGAQASSAPATAPSPIAGQWRTDDNKSIIRIAPCGNALCGTISRFLVPEPAGGARDGSNPNRALRNRPLIGVQILTGLTRNGNSWTGRGYNPEDGRSFNATVTLPASNRLSLRGCVAIFCKTVVWTRVS